MTLSTLPVISLGAGADELPGQLGASFREFGFAMVSDHGIDAGLIDAAWQLTAEFFALPEAEKRKHFRAELFGARGYTPFGREIAKGARHSDLKEFWHVGRDLPADHQLTNASMPPNVWPARPEGFRETFQALYAEFDRVGARLLSHIAVHLGLAADWFEGAVAEGNSVLRLLHYPPLPGDPGGAIRAGAHEDINLITLLLGAEEAGLELLARDGRWLAVNPPPGALVINIGDMLQRLTNHVYPSTTHRVTNPPGEQARKPRYSVPFFLHPNPDVVLDPLDSCISSDNPRRYTTSIT